MSNKHIRKLLNRYARGGVFVFMTIWFGVMDVYAQNVNNASSPAANYHRKVVNQGTVGIISGGIAGTYIRIATDLASVLDDNKKHTLRILPIAGKGGVRNIRDLLYLRGIDVGIVQSDVLDFIENNNLFSNIRKRIHYVTKLYNAEFHIITKTNVKNIRELEGKKVNFWHKGSATDMTGSTLFKILGINVIPVHMDQQLAIEKVKSGELIANMLLVGKPSKRFANITPSDGLKLLPVKFEGKLTEIYLPSGFSSSDYPGLVQKGQTVSTIASGAVLAVYNWPENHPRYKKVANFIRNFFARFPEFRKPPRHKKWREVNLNTKLPGWTRFSAAQRLLDRKGLLENTTTNLEYKNEFANFLNSQAGSLGQLSGEQRQELFQKFLQWRNRTQ